jgi:hypothetical protein
MSTSALVGKVQVIRVGEVPKGTNNDLMFYDIDSRYSVEAGWPELYNIPSVYRLLTICTLIRRFLSMGELPHADDDWVQSKQENLKPLSQN